MPDPTNYDVFLSHNSNDKTLVEQLARKLKTKGVKPFLDKWHLIPGEPWQEALEKALDQSNTCAVFIGPKGVSPWEHEEMRAAIRKRVSDKKKVFRVIPVLLPGAEINQKLQLPPFLSRSTLVKFRVSIEDEEAFRRLVAGIKGIAPGDHSSPSMKDETDTGFTPPSSKDRLIQLRKNILPIFLFILFLIVLWISLSP